LATTSHRPRLSEEFISEHRKARILTGFSHCVVKLGYQSVAVADITRETGIARNTFYDNFSGKDAVAAALLRSVCPDLEVDAGAKIGRDSAMILAVELAAPLRLGDADKLNSALADGLKVVGDAIEFVAKTIRPAGEGDPEQAKLPPGRHGLDPGFVRRNQRLRLLDGTARAVHAYGCPAATIADITRLAAVSRRTFYEHFDGKREAVEGLIAAAESEHGAPRTGCSLDSGLGMVWAEIVAAQLCGHRSEAAGSRQDAERVVDNFEVGC
jgi:AcrR family transcriptional regulator